MLTPAAGSELVPCLRSWTDQRNSRLGEQESWTAVISIQFWLVALSPQLERRPTRLSHKGLLLLPAPQVLSCCVCQKSTARFSSRATRGFLRGNINAAKTQWLPKWQQQV